jgi:tetratricopeptide (TPR) repeat protein
MKRSILAGALVLTAGLFGLMAQAPAQNKGPQPKSEAEGKAVQALFQASQGPPDGVIKAAEDLLTKFADTEFKEIALYLTAISWQQKGDAAKAMFYGDKVLEINPKNFSVTLMMGEIPAQSTRENDLDRDEKLGKAEKYLNDTIENLKTAPKPNPQVTDAQWEEGKKQLNAEAHQGLGMIAMTRKKYDVAVGEFKTAADGDPQPTYQVRLASAYQKAGKNTEALAIVDKLLADPNLHPAVKNAASGIKAEASKK